jgi:hypothetical protein
VLSVQRDRGLAEVPKAGKSSIVGGDRWKKMDRFGSRNFKRFVKRKQNSSRSREV